MGKVGDPGFLNAFCGGSKKTIKKEENEYSPDAGIPRKSGINRGKYQQPSDEDFFEAEFVGQQAKGVARQGEYQVVKYIGCNGNAVTVECLAQDHQFSTL